MTIFPVDPVLTTFDGYSFEPVTHLNRESAFSLFCKPTRSHNKQLLVDLLR